MRVLFYSTIFPRPWNPIRGIYCFHVCRSLVQLGHEVRVVSPLSWLERAGAPTSLPGLSELNVEYPPYVYPPRVLQSAHDVFMAISSRRTMKRVMGELRPDCLLSYWAHPDGAVAARFAHGAQIPSGVIVGGSDVLVLARHAGRRRRSVVRALRSSDAVITVGRQLADTVEGLGIPASKVHVVYQGVDDALFSPGPATEARQRLGIPEGGKVLVSVGNLLPVKGVDVLLEAMVRLAARRSDVRLYLVGDGASRGDLEALAARLGLMSVTRFVGKVAQSALPDWYRAADLTVLASRSEGVPNVLRESLACGTPFVATRVGGVHEIAAGTTNRLVPPEDPSALSNAIAESLAEARGPFTTEGLLTWQQSTQQILNVLERARSSDRRNET
ncbi:MAG TPA: glycosyltransferase [Polyangiaceae bacterium]|jgi:glycosyltransferase involved in cell wall biosynthesis|nr:glycosyltransferase [Polyangiaceae bacterium]